MSKEFRTRTFKSGNSIALRLPKALGFTEGDEVAVVPHADGSFSMYPVDSALELFMTLPGKLSPGFMAGGRGDIEQSERDWNHRGDAAAA